MKKFLLSIFPLLLVCSVLAQAPLSFNYQAVLRDHAGQVMASEEVTLDISILQGSMEGQVIFTETHQTHTNDFGLVNLHVGSVSSLEDIDWGEGPYFLQVALNGDVMGTTQLLSVPYALHATTSADAFSGDYEDLENAPDLDQFVGVESPSDGDLVYFDGNAWISIPLGEEGQVLSVVDGTPAWKDIPGNGNGNGNGETGTVTDVEGNVYQTVKIGEQWWMAENLRTSQYNNGDNLLTGLDDTQWEHTTQGAYSIYENDDDNLNTYGKLYNWHAVMDNRGLCPAGWHLPTDEEWQQMEMHLGMSQDEAEGSGWRGTDEGGKLKATGTDYWDDPNTGATNESGFTALPAGGRTYLGMYIFLNEWAYFWTSTEQTADYSSWYRVLSYNSAQVFRFYNHQNSGFAVRCVMSAE